MDDCADRAREGEAVLGESLTLFDLRNRVVDCLYATQGERFGRSRMDLGLEHDEKAVRASVEGIVRLAFHTSGGSYDAPTSETLMKVVNVMAERALSWGASADEVFEQHCAMTRHIGRFELMQSPGQIPHSPN
ncbi:MAG: hypothetical protein EG823_00230 [Actinobacteria bacterium]|nr:hypothetical protein [Actinomycetota bacterium]